MKIDKTPGMIPAAPVASKAPAAPAAATAPTPIAGGKGWSPNTVGPAGKSPPAIGAGPAAKGPSLVDSEVARLQKAMKGMGTTESVVFEVLEKNPPALVAAIATAFEAKTGMTLRKALNGELSGADLRRGLSKLDALHVRPTDTTGTSGIAEKVIELRKQGTISESELVNTYAPTTNNKIDLLIQGDTAFPRMMQDIDAAKDHVHVSFYIFSNDAQGNEMADKLIAAKKRGCDVRVMMDGIGSQLVNPMSDNYDLIKKMESAGIEIRKNHVVDVTRDSQVLNHPDHRKIVITDGKVGYTGGMNMANHYRSEYHDVMVRAEGDVVKQMQGEWTTAWMHLGGKIGGDDASFKQRYFPEYKPGEAPGKTQITNMQSVPGENPAILKMYLEKINSSTKSVKIENPYCTNPDIQNALIKAAKRGVDVTVILPGESDHAFSHLAAAQKYPEMINAGVKIYEYPGFNHDKVMVVDDKFTTVGSSNLDDVALYHIYEMNLNVDNEAFAKETSERLFAKDVSVSKLMKASDISKLDQITGKFWNLFNHFI